MGPGVFVAALGLMDILKIKMILIKKNFFVTK
jgi:hypothetical protein